MNNDTRAALAQALEALREVRHWAEGSVVSYTGEHPIAMARDAIAAAEAALAAPQEPTAGWVLVPASPTNDMSMAGQKERKTFGSSIASVYRAMLAAAPAAPANQPLTAAEIIAEGNSRYTLATSAQAFADGALWAALRDGSKA